LEFFCTKNVFQKIKKKEKNPILPDWAEPVGPTQPAAAQPPGPAGPIQLLARGRVGHAGAAWGRSRLACLRPYKGEAWSPSHEP
jgi:hypothetical protein